MERIKFKPLFLIYVFLCVYFSWYNNIFFYIITVVLHEYGHCFVAKCLGYNTNGIVFDLYGAGLRSGDYLKRKDDILISLAGPFVNVLIILIVMAGWWIFPSSYAVTNELVICNIMVMIFNLLPIYPLDGGRVVVAVLGKKIKKKKVLKFSGIICLITGTIFLLIFVISLFYAMNINILFISVFLIGNSIMCLQNLKYDFLQIVTSKKLHNIETKIWKVDNFDNVTLLKLISRDYYSIFVMYKLGKKYIKYEEEIFN